MKAILAMLLLLHPSVKDGNLKEKALSILETKCNFCHRKQNPLRIFRERNMDRNAKDIYTQVFVEKTMPLGGRLTLTQEEMKVLKAWIVTQLKIE